MRTHLKETLKTLNLSSKRRYHCTCVSFSLPGSPPTEFFFLSAQEEKSERRKKRNTEELWMTFVVKLHGQWHLGWMDWKEKKKRRFAPAKEWSPSIQRMPADWTVLTQNWFWFRVPVALSAAGFRSHQVFNVCPVSLKTSRARTEVTNHSWKHALLPPRTQSLLFPRDSPTSTPTLLCWRPPDAVSVTVESTWLKMFPNIETT